MSNGGQKIWEIARGFQTSRVILSAVELGVFGALGEQSRTSAEVARDIGADARATDRLLNALVALGLLTKRGESFANGSEARETLVPGEPRYAGGAIGHAISMWDSWSTLTKAVRAGTRVLNREGAQREEWVVPFIEAMHYNSSARANSVLEHIDLREVQRVLDVGGGSGAYSMAFCAASPVIEAVVFDLPDVTPLTRKYVEDAGMSDRISTINGDYNTDELGSGFDIAFLSAIIHSNSPKQNIELFRKCRRAVSDGGRIVVQDFIMDPDRTSPAHAAIFALNMLVATDAGDTFTEAEVRDWFEKAGFEFVQRADPPEAGATLLIGRAV